MTHTLLAIDAMSLLYRAYYSVPSTLKLNGQPINGVFGFASILFQIIDKINPHYLVVCFDVKEPTFRHQLFTDYKGHRPPAPEDLVPQIYLLKEFLNDLKLPYIEKPGFEADDIMGTLCKLSDAQEIQCYLMTGDQDALQLASSHTTIILNKKGVSDIVFFTPEKVQEVYQFSPTQLIDFKALKGDASDNIPGVKGIGDKTALNLITDYHSVEKIYENLEKIQPPRIQELLRNGRDSAFLSKELATIHRDIPMDSSMEPLRFTPDWSLILQTLHRFEFQNLIKKYQSRAINTVKIINEESSEVSPTRCHLIEKIDELTAILPELHNGFSIDLETTSLTILDAQIVGVSISNKIGEGYYIPLNRYVDKNELSGGVTLELFQSNEAKNPFQNNPFLTTLKPILENPEIPKYTHNGKYDDAVLQNYGIHMKGIVFDSMIAAYLTEPGEKIGLKELSKRLLNVTMTDYESIAGKGKTAINFLDIPIETASHYAAADSDMTLRLKDFLKNKLKENNLEKLFYDIELPTQATLAVMERNGIKLDINYLAGLQHEFSQKTEQLKKEVFTMVGHEFNLNSPKQLSEILFQKLQLPIIKETKTGNSTDSSVLEKLKKSHPIAELLLSYRTLEKLLSTYVLTLPKLVHHRTHRIHTSYNQVVVLTGRLSSHNPNLQNIPIRSEEGSKIRQAFIPTSSDYILLSADYSQIELRILAHLSNDPNMIAAFQKGEDIHQATASLIFDIPLDQVSKEHRYRAKTVNFGIIYGQSAFGLSETLSIPRAEAKAIIEAYYEKFPTIRQFMDNTIQEAREKGYVTTEFGRIRPLAEINDRNVGKRQFAERVAVNTRMQGTAADIIKLAMVKIQSEIESQKLQSKMLLQVHDELVFDILKTEESIMIPLVKKTMEEVYQMSVPLLVDTATGNNWGEAS